MNNNQIWWIILGAFIGLTAFVSIWLAILAEVLL